MDSSEDAFGQLIREHGPMLARFVRYRIPNPNDAEDVLQETLVAAWLGFRRLRDPARMSSWLLSVAQNRCRDYFRSQGRRELPLEEEALQDHANRFGLHQYRQASTLTDVEDALEAAPPAAREVARHFYFEGLTIAEIAASSQRPPGTVKRQLFQARHAARAFLGVTIPSPLAHKEKPIMKTDAAANTAENPPLFPLTRPKITITEMDEAPFAVDCRELRAWPIIPQVGEQASSADYVLTADAPTEWNLSEGATMQVLRTGSVHDVDGVEIEVRTWNPKAGWQRPGTAYARLTQDKAEFLAVHLPQEDFTQIETFLDSNFVWNWGTIDRAISDRGFLQHVSDGSLALSVTSPQKSTGTGFGVVRVEVGDRSFTCLRALDIPDLTVGDNDYLTEYFLTSEGRTVLVRRYCRPGFAEVVVFPIMLDEAERVVINGIEFVHWYDTIMGIAL